MINAPLPESFDACVWRWRPLLAALAIGWLASLLNHYPLHLQFPPHQVSLNPGLALPLLVAVAWGWRYALVAAIPGTGALFALWTWPQNGWVNVAVSLAFVGWLVWHGWAAQSRLCRPSNQRPWYHHLYAVEVFSALCWVVFYYTVYRWTFAFNPPPWNPQAITATDLDVVHRIVIKSALSNLGAVFLVDLLLNAHVVRRLFGLSIATGARSGTVLLAGGMIAALVVLAGETLIVWQFFNEAERSLVAVAFMEVEPYRSLIRVLVVALCGLGALIATRYLRAQLIAEESLRQREEDLAITLDSIGDGVIATDADGTVTRLNPVAEYLTGWPRQEAIGRPLAEVFHIINAQTRRLCENPAEKVLEQGRVVGLANHTMLVDRSGRERQIADSAAPILDDTANIRGVVLVFRDVTDAYRIDERLRQAEKMESLGLLAGGVAHDFNNMLGGIMGYAELIAAQLGGDHPVKRHLEGIIGASERAADLTMKLLSFSHKGRSQAEPFDLHQCLSDAMDLLETSLNRRIVVRRYFMAQRMVVMGNRSRLQNAFLNLGLNARDAMVEGGSITVTTEDLVLDKDDTRLRQQMLAPGPYISIVVSDTGCGMPPDVLERVFEPFFTTKGLGRGTGLGLAAVYGAISDDHGAITMTSELGVGTSVSILLPLSEVTTEDVDAEFVEPSGASGVVLIAEDDASLREVAARHLTALGYEVLTAEDGQQAVAIYEQQQSRIKAVVLDMVMPRMNGHEAFTRIRAVNPEARVLLCSGYTAGTDIDELLAQGLCGFVAKPYRRRQLARALNEAIKK